jgi:hypothetical protein
LVASAERADTLRKVFIFRALTGGSPTTGAVLIDYDAQGQANCEWSVTEVADCLLTGTNGADAIVQTKAAVNAGSSSHSVTFDSAYDDAENRAFGVFTHNSATKAFTAGSNYAVLGQTLGSGSNAGLCSLHGRDGDLVVDVTTTDGSHSWVGLIAEIAGAADGAPPSADLQSFIRRRGFNFGMR